MTYFVTIAGRRWAVEETFKTGKDVLSLDQSQVRTCDGICRHIALAALAQLRHIAAGRNLEDIPGSDGLLKIRKVKGTTAWCAARRFTVFPV